MHTSVTHQPYELVIRMESPGRVEVTTSTHDSRIRTALQHPYECRGLERKRARTHEQVTNGARGADDHVHNSVVDDPTGCNHQLGARVGPRLTQIARSRGV